MVYFQHFQLRDNGQLPPHCTIKDPLNGRYFNIPPNAKLDEVIGLFQFNRRSNSEKEPNPDYLEHFIVAQLIEQTPSNEREKYFKPLKVLPTSSQVLSFVRTVASEFVNGDVVGIAKRQNRAQHCLKCPFHRKGSLVAPKIPSILEPTTPEQHESGLAATYPEEDRLGACGMCGCNLKSKVKFNVRSTLIGLTPENIDNLLSFMGPKAFSACWILEESLADADTKKLLRGKLRNGTRNGEALLKQFQDGEASNK